MYRLLLLPVLLASISGPTVARVAPLANCPARCDCDDNTLIVSCGQGSLDVLPIALNPSIRRLAISDNRIKTIDSSIQFYAELQFLDLSNNQLLTIPDRTFQYQRKLTELQLHRNKITAISQRTFTGLSAVSVLNLRANHIVELTAGVFATMPQLRELNLGGNQIARIDAGAFAGLKNLRVLYLDDNQLTAVPTLSFAPIAALAELYIGVNVLSGVGAGVNGTAVAAPFATLASLELLSIASASLHNISTNTLRGLEQLRSLDLTDNRLQRVPTVELSHLGRLEELSIGQNEFAVLPEGAFAGMHNLRTVDCSGSLALRKVQAAAFAANTNLERIRLTANKRLTELQEGAFSGLPHLKHIELRDNALTTLAEGLFPWSALATFDLAENPWHCDCRLQWLRNLLLAQHRNGSHEATATETVFCATPERLREEPLKVLTSELLGCVHLESSRQQAAMLGVVLVGAAAFITALLLVGYRCRSQIWLLLFKSRLQSAAAMARASSKEREYQKTFVDEQLYYARSFAHPCASSVNGGGSMLGGVHPSLYAYPQLQFNGAMPSASSAPTLAGVAVPVTEL